MVLQLSTCTVDLSRLAVLGATGEVRLTTREAELLQYLAEHASQAVTRDELLREVWGYSDNVVSRAADNAVRRLREKVERDPANPVHIVTVFGTGYRFEPTVAPVAAAVPTQSDVPDASVVQLGDKSIDLRRQRIEVRGAARPLTAVESGVLAYLMAHPGRPVTRRELLRKVWQRSATSASRAVDSAMARLRVKLEDDPAEPVHLLTVRGVGYRFAFGRANDAPPVGEVALVGAAWSDEADLWASEPGLAGEVVAAVGDLFRSLAERHDGYLARQDGGSFRLAFESAGRALRFCLEAQERLMDLPQQQGPALAPLLGADGTVLFAGPRVAMAVHSGTPVVSQSPDTGRTVYRGPTADHLDALLAATASGQTLVTATAWSAVSESTQALALAEPLGDLLPTGSPTDRQVVSAVPRALGGRVFTASGPAGNVHGAPPGPSAFFGRGEEMDRVRRLVRGGGVVTLLGPPGIGKTSLAARIATEPGADWPGGVWWVDLAPTRTRAEVVRAVAERLGVMLHPTADPAGRLAHALANRGRAMLVLDNYEQVVDCASDIAATLAAGAPGAAVLITSRTRLDLDGEQAFDVTPIARADAIRLFDHRAGRARTGYDPHADADAVALLVERLDDMPLAVELAAARVGLMSPRQLLDRVGDRLTLLVDKRRSRYATLEAAIAWSWGLLAPWEQAAMAQLSVFRGGFTLDTAEALVDLTPWPDAPEVVDVLQGLRDHSLLRSWADPEQPGVVRLGPYESIRAFAAARRRADREGDHKARRRFVSLYAQYGTIAFLDSLETHGGPERLRLLAGEFDNLVTATEHAHEVSDPGDIGRCALAAVRVLELRAPFHLGTEIGERALKLPLPQPVRARLAYWVARCMRAYDLHEPAREHARAAEHDARACGDTPTECAALAIRAQTLMDQYRWPEARERYTRAAQIAAAAGMMAAHHFWLAKVHRMTPDGGLPEAERLFTQALRAAELQGNAVLASAARSNIARIASLRGRLQDAVTLYDEAMDGMRALGDRQWELRSMHQKATALLELGRYEEHAAVHRKALAAARASARVPEEVLNLMELAHACRLSGNLDEAARLLREAAPMIPGLGDVHLRAYHQLRTAELCLDRDDLAGARHHAQNAVDLWATGANAWPQAYASSALALVMAAQGELDPAVALGTQAVETLTAYGVPFDLGVATARLGLIHAERGEIEAARHALASTQALLQRTGAGARSELGQAAHALQQRLA